MLGKAISSGEDIIKVCKNHENKIITEKKYDGERIQIHWDGENVSLFSRNLEDNSDKYGALNSNLKKIFSKMNINLIILDGEIVPIKNDKILGFTYMNKIPEEGEVEAKIVLFDILRLDDKEMLSKPFSYRRSILEKLEFNSKLLTIIESFEFDIEKQNWEKELDQLLNQTKSSGLEGLLVKPQGSRSLYIGNNKSIWMKLKSGSDESIRDTFDLAVIGAYSGRGKRKNLFGSFLLAALDPKTGNFVPVSKIGTGFSDQILQELYHKLSELKIQNPHSNISKIGRLKPDYWIKPQIIFEVRCDSISLSSFYQGANEYTTEGQGVSLRFARLLRVRDDKELSDLSSVLDILQNHPDYTKIE